MTEALGMPPNDPLLVIVGRASDLTLVLSGPWVAGPNDQGHYKAGAAQLADLVLEHRGFKPEHSLGMATDGPSSQAFERLQVGALTPAKMAPATPSATKQPITDK